jgi:putative transposase
MIFVCKYRRKLLVSDMGDQVKQLLRDIAEENDVGIVKMETDKDHVHLLVSYNPTQSVLQIVRLLKQVSTYRLWRQNGNAERLMRCFWREQTFWSDGYFASSIGNASKATIEQYIGSQG